MPGSPLEGDLRSLGFDVRTAPGTASADDLETLLRDLPAGERVAVVDHRFVGHVHALRLGLTDPRFPVAAVPGAMTAQSGARGELIRALRAAAGAAGAVPTGGTVAPVAGDAPAAGDALPGRIPAAGAAGAADPDRIAAGAAVPDRIAAGAAVPDLSVAGAAIPDRIAAAGDALPDRIAAALKAAGTDVHRPELGTLVATVADDPQTRNTARQAVAAVDDEAVRLRGAVKARDGFFTTYCVSPYSRHLARWSARRGLTPNQVTTASLLTALIAAGCAATGTRGGFVAAGLLLLFSFVLDCTDGQLARYSLQYSTLGAWLDATFDRAKEYAYYAGLALGAARGGDDVWALALGAMVLQTCRHVVDFSFNEANADSTATGNTSPTAALSDKLDSVGWTVWLRRMIVLPIGERWALIAVLTALTTPRVTLVVLLVGCALAACYTTAGRVLRSLTRKAARTDRAARALGDLADNGPLGSAFAALRPRLALPAPALALVGGAAVVGTALLTSYGSPWVVVGAVIHVITSGLALARPLKGALDWLVPPFFRVAEYSTVLVLAAKADVNGCLPAAFGLVAAVAYHHYDTVYRIKGGTGAPPRWLVRTIGGQEGRTLVVALAAALLHDTDLTVALTALAVAVALVVLVESIHFWVTAHKRGAPAVHDEGETA
ncbi:CDP-alcohol phosphatidyltransferase family protein [Streptomyces sp. p1417]|uniref:CDP-alcohol phosphatidyltransferase family protein n=1 Tax=Streptomyces typhae TaxID=2681492 RepID=A0A6L6WZZ3_9ACTN|nr:CDP-alcohol phosphatidyltransferase family protein [Streptomyces typhae]